MNRLPHVTGDHVELGYVDQGYTGQIPATAATQHGIKLKLSTPQAKGMCVAAAPLGRGALGCVSGSFPRLARDDERLATTPTGYHWLAYALLMLKSIFAKSARQVPTDTRAPVAVFFE